MIHTNDIFALTNQYPAPIPTPVITYLKRRGYFLPFFFTQISLRPTNHPSYGIISAELDWTAFLSPCQREREKHNKAPSHNQIIIELPGGLITLVRLAERNQMCDDPQDDFFTDISKKKKDPAKQRLQSRRIAFFGPRWRIFCNGRGRDGLRPNTRHSAAS